MTADAGQPPKDLIGFLDFYLVQKAPFQIPDAGREWIVRFAPWIVLVMLVLSLPPLLFALGIGAVLAPFAGATYAAGFTYLTVVLVAQIALTGMALPGLFARRTSGWRLVFYAQLVGLVFSALSGSIVSALVGAAIGLYILFQVRELYR